MYHQTNAEISLALRRLQLFNATRTGQFSCRVILVCYFSPILSLNDVQIVLSDFLIAMSNTKDLDRF